MSAKRQATSNLNHDNWDQDDEPEERGTFRTAASEELNKRIIKKARRKITDSSDAADGTANKSVFSGFTGFGKRNTASSSGGDTSSASTAPSPFSFLSKLPVAATSSASTNAPSSSTTTATKPTFIFGGSATSAVSSTVAPAAKTTSPDSTAADSTTYYAKLKGLNQAVSDWIKTHVDKNPLCILTPIFKDYEKYLDEIKKDENKPSNVMPTTVDGSDDKPAPKSNAPAFGTFKYSSSSPAISSPEKKTTTASSIFGNISKPAEIPKTNGFSFGLKSDSITSSTASSSTGFSFGNPTISATSSKDDKPAATAGFSFTPGAAPFSFGNIKPPAAMPTAPVNDEEDNEEDKPKKNEFKQVVEDDAVYSIKCKVFVKKDGNFTERGVGTLYLKPVEDSEKTQLLVRADTNLGNILVNLILSAGIPTQRMGKNNVMLVCLPLPETDKPTSMLLRVKTAEEADELLETIEKYKK